MMLNLTKEDIEQFCYCQVIPFYILYIFGCFLNAGKSPIETATSLWIITFYSYLIHVLLHIIPTNFNVHYLFHHVYNLTPAFNLSVEFLTNIFVFVLFYALQRMLNTKVVSDEILLYYSMVYVSGHIINYSIFKVRNHEIHHMNVDMNREDNVTKICNYGPDPYDHIIGTNYDNCWEDYMHLVPNIGVSFLTCYYIFFVYRSTGKDIEN